MGEELAQPDWVKNTEKTLQGIEEGLKIGRSVDQPDWVKDAEEHSYALAKEKYAGEARTYEKIAESGYLVIDTVVNLPFTESAGLYLSKFFITLRDQGKILANRCPRCQRIVFPPRIVCGFCKIRIPDKDENWVELSDKGTVLSYTVVTEREVDRVTGKVIGQPYPCAFIRLDGGDEWTLMPHFLEERELDRLHNGMRVKAVWKPREERRARMSDILYFRTIEE